MATLKTGQAARFSFARRQGNRWRHHGSASSGPRASLVGTTREITIAVPSMQKAEW